MLSSTSRPHCGGSEYDSIAEEYYDADRHPTSANFREASVTLIHAWLETMHATGKVVLEVGCGRSIVAETLERLACTPQRLYLTDASAAMLEYSRRWVDRASELLLADATAIPLKESSVDLLISSLGDPYNTARFWREAFRVMRPNSHGFFTSPSDVWAARFRASQGSAADEAGFRVSDGRDIRVTSVILSQEKQNAKITAAGFWVESVASLSVSALSTPLSKKLLGLKPRESVLHGYHFRKSDNP